MFQKSSYIILFIIISFLIFLLGLTNNWVTINLLILVVCLLGLVFDRLFILFLYIIFLPTNGIISADYNLFGILNLQRLLYVFSIIVFILEGKNYKAKTDDFTGFAIKLLVFFLLYNVFAEIKNYYFSLYDTTAKNLVNRTVKDILMFGSSILLCKHIKNETVNKLFEFSIYVSIVFLTISHIFSLDLYKIGFLTQGVFEGYYGMQASEFGRSSGFFGHGDQNSFGVFLAIAAGYYFSKTEISENKLSDFLPIIVLCGISIVLTGSRTAIGTFVIVVMLYWYRNKGSLRAFAFILVLFIGILAISQYTSFFDKIIARFSTTSSEFVSTGTSSRHVKWLFYLNHIFSDMKNLVIGSREMIYLNGNIRAAHNLYIAILFDLGILFLVYLLILYSKFYSFAIHEKNKYNLLYVIIPFLIISMLVSDWGYIYYFVFFIALNEKVVQIPFQTNTC